MGYILIPIGLLLLFFNIDYLLFAMVLFSGFTASSIINFLNIDFSLQPSYYFGILFIFKYIYFIALKKKLVKPNKYLFVFIVFCTGSLVIPIILQSKDVLILSVDGKIEKLRFSIQNITQYVYMLFCFFIYWFVKDRLNSKNELIKKLLNIYFIGAFIICLLGFYQMIAFQLELPFDELFRSGLHGNVQGNRVYAVAGEPSILAFYIVPTLALLIFIDNINFTINKKLLIIMLFITGVFSTSSTFLFGIGLFAVLFVKRNFVKFKFSKLNIMYMKKFLIFFTLAMIFLIFIVSTNEFVKEILVDGTIDKLMKKNVSGTQRSEFFLLMLGVALRYPLTGVGFGSSRSTDLISTWLANIGFIGTGIFIIYIFNMYRNLSREYKKRKDGILEGTIFFIVIVILSAFISVPEPYYLFIWINFAIAEVYINLKKEG